VSELAQPAELKLVALDGPGLEIISAYLQNSCLKASDIAWFDKQGRFVAKLMRYDWVAAKAGSDERVGAVLRFDRVSRVSRLGTFAADRPLNLIGARFEKIDPPSGMVILAFEDGGVLRLDVECVEVELRDIGPRAPAGQCDGHLLTHPEAV
jgi:hypothetical protein